MGVGGMISECGALGHVHRPSGQPPFPKSGSISTRAPAPGRGFLSGWFSEPGCGWGHGPIWRPW